MEPGAHLHSQPRHVAGTDPSVALLDLGQGGALQQLHGDVEDPVLLVGVVQGYDVGVVEGRSCSGFSEEELRGSLVLTQVVG
jgi:hypothetical protein